MTEMENYLCSSRLKENSPIIVHSDITLKQAERVQLNDKLNRTVQNERNTENVNEDELNKGVLDEVGNIVCDTEENYLTANNAGNTSTESDIVLNSDDDRGDDIIQKTNKNRKKYPNFIDSDSDEDNLLIGTPLRENDIEDLPRTNPEVKTKKHKRLVLIDSDSDLENAITTHNKSVSKDIPSQMGQQSLTDTNEELVTPNSSFTLEQKARLTALCDSESSDDDMDGNESNNMKHASHEDKVKVEPYKKKNRTKEGEEAKPRKMTGKEAAELRKEIKSESQRMVREKNISLPYHKPKSYTLKEFLERRPKLAVSCQPSVPPSVAIKMSKEQLAVISKRLEEREKQVKKFYKSESESEDDDGDKDYISPEEEKRKKELTQENVDSTDGSKKKQDQGSGGRPDGIEKAENKVEQCQKITGDTDETIGHRDCVPLENEDGSERCSENGDKSSEALQDKNCPLLEEAKRDECQESGHPTKESGLIRIAVGENEDKAQTFTNEADESVNQLTAENSFILKNTEENNIAGNENRMECEENNETINLKEHNNNINGCDKIMEENCDALYIVHDNIQADGASFNMVEENATISDTLHDTMPSSSMDYEFNLDDIEENSERVVVEDVPAKDTTVKQKSNFTFSDLDREIENFGLSGEKEPAECSIDVKPLSKLDLIKEKLANIKPKLSGRPDAVIDLGTGIAKPNDVTRLMHRFAKHTLKKPTHKNKVELSIVSVESGEIHKETVAMNVEEDDSTVIEEKPGVKLQKLRQNLQTQLAQMRSEFWQKKAAQNLNVERKDPYEGAKQDCGADDDILDDEEEEVVLTESSEDEEEEEDDVEDTAKGKVKSAFIDEEAVESELEDEEAVEADNKEEYHDDEVEVNDDATEGEPNEDENSQSSGIAKEPEEQPTKRTLKRIVKGFTEDSDDEDFDLISQTVNEPKTEKLKNFNTTPSEDDDDILPPHQPQSSQTPQRQIIQTQSRPEFDFLTPISYITGIQNLNNSAVKMLKSSPHMSAFERTLSPLKESNWEDSLQKKLFTDADITDSQLKEVAGLCSGTFPETQAANDTDSVNEEELANMCSGKFPSTLEVKAKDLRSEELSCEKTPTSGQSQEELLVSDGPPSTQDLLDICSGAFTGITQIHSVGESDSGSNTNLKTHTFGADKEIKTLDEDQGLIISQLIDEEEMEQFKRKFDSPLLSSTQKRIVEEFEEVVGSGRVIDSDDEDETLEVRKKKKQRMLVFSDDENSEEENEQDEEVIDLHDNTDNDDDQEVVSNVDNIVYDSEENEIEHTEVNAKPSDFFENEAELSESEWDSADEDEKDLDTLELEQGDAEKFDEKKIKSDLERIHMRRLLDDDTREVKLLQELLLEDGELHGTGREKQFKWKNIDLMDGEDGSEQRREDDIYIEEEESEEQWRKRRHEREMFLKEKMKKSRDMGDDDLLSESQLLKIGHRVIQRSQTSSHGSTPTENPETAPSSPVVKQPFALLNKRGSFLSRNDQVLQRLAEYNKTTSVTLGAAKSSRNFLFQTISEEQTSVVVVQSKKRQSDDATPKAIKKLRLSSNFSPAEGKAKLEKPPSATAELFGSW